MKGYMLCFVAGMMAAFTPWAGVWWAMLTAIVAFLAGALVMAEAADRESE